MSAAKHRQLTHIIAAELVNGAIADAIDDVDSERRDEAAQKISEAYKQYLVKQETLSLARAKKQEERKAAIAIQSSYRGHRAKERSKSLTHAEEPVEQVPEESMPAPDPDTEAVDDRGAFEIEIMNFDDRTPEQREEGAKLMQKYIRLGPPQFKSPLLARSFLQTVHEFEKRELAVRSRISKRIFDHITNNWAKTAKVLSSLHTMQASERHHIVNKEHRFRRLEIEEEELARAALIKSWTATRFGGEWADLFEEMCIELVEEEGIRRSSLSKQQETARIALAVAEEDSKRMSSRSTPATRPQTMSRSSHRPLSVELAKERSVVSTGFSQNFTSSLVNLRTKCMLMRHDHEQEKRLHAQEVKAEKEQLQSQLVSTRIKTQASNFARSVKQRDEAKARRKEFINARQLRNADLREKAKDTQLASRRTVHESRHPNDANVYKRLLAPIGKRQKHDRAMDTSSFGGTSASRSEFPGLFEGHQSPQRLESESGDMTSREVFDPEDAYRSPISTQTQRKERRNVTNISSQLDRLEQDLNSRPATRESVLTQPALRLKSRSAMGKAPLHPKDEKLQRLVMELHVQCTTAAQPSTSIGAVSLNTVGVHVHYAAPEPILLGDDGDDVLDAAKVYAPDVDMTRLTLAERIARWNELAKRALAAGDIAASDNHLTNATTALQEMEHEIRDHALESSTNNASLWKSTGSIPTTVTTEGKTLSNLRIITFSNCASLARRRKRFRFALQHLKSVLEEEEMFDGPSPSTLVNIAAILSQIEGESETSIFYSRKAAEILALRCSEELETIIGAKQQLMEEHDDKRSQLTSVDVVLQHPNIRALAVSALHNTAVAQSVCPPGKEMRTAQVMPSERQSCQTTYAAALKLAKVVLPTGHPLIASVEASSSRIAEALSSHM